MQTTTKHPDFLKTYLNKVTKLGDTTPNPKWFITGCSARQWMLTLFGFQLNNVTEELGSDYQLFLHLDPAGILGPLTPHIIWGDFNDIEQQDCMDNSSEVSCIGVQGPYRDSKLEFLCILGIKAFELRQTKS